MNKKEIAEIKKQFTQDRCPLTRICGCYVNGDKEKVVTFKDAFLSLEEEAFFKYLDLLRKALSGGIGKNLLTLEFPLNEERADGKQAFLMKLREDGLSDDTLLEKFYDTVISSYDSNENYLILAVHGAYDIPGKTRDNLDMFDASDEVYTFIMGCICPVALSKPGLSFDAESLSFINRLRDWVVGMPAAGFLFPAFTDRQTDIHSLLYYTKNAGDLHADLTDALFGAALPLSAGTQKDVFVNLVEEALEEECDFDTVRNLHMQLHEITAAAKDQPDPVVLSEGEVKNLLSLSGAPEEKLALFDAHFEHAAGENTEFVAANIAGSGKFLVETPDIKITVSGDRADLIDRKIIDGQPCLVIPITDEVYVNGICVRNQPVSSGNAKAPATHSEEH